MWKIYYFQCKKVSFYTKYEIFYFLPNFHIKGSKDPFHSIEKVSFYSIEKVFLHENISIFSAQNSLVINDPFKKKILHTGVKIRRALGSMARKIAYRPAKLTLGGLAGPANFEASVIPL